VCVLNHIRIFFFFFSFLTHFHSLRPFFLPLSIRSYHPASLSAFAISAHIHRTKKGENVKNSGIQFLDNSVWR
jgi:hypothetical protein